MVSIGQSCGFCLDTSPDEKIHHVVDNLYIASQDGAQNIQELKDHNITHILNVAMGVVNAFQEVRPCLFCSKSCVPSRDCLPGIVFRILYTKPLKFQTCLKKTLLLIFLDCLPLLTKEWQMGARLFIGNHMWAFYANYF